MIFGPLNFHNPHPNQVLGLQTNEGEGYDLQSYIVVLNSGKQGWFSVALILDHILNELEQESPHLTEAVVKSDQAGCYKASHLMQFINKRNGNARLKVKRYDFSEAQSGKDICDSRSACAKFHILKYVDRGHNVETSSEMKEALDFAGGVKGLKTCVVDINQKAEPKKLTAKITKITDYSSFEFGNNEVRVWKAYNIGSGN